MSISAILEKDVSHVCDNRAWLGIFALGILLIGSMITASAFADDECSGVTSCLSTPDSQARTIPPNGSLNFDVSCSQDSSAPYMWNWHVVKQSSTNRHHHPGGGGGPQTIDISLVKIQTDTSGNDVGVSLRIDNSAEYQPAVLLIKLGCSPQPFPYTNAGRKQNLSFPPNSQ
jgi:hypothetical protein